MFEKIKNINTSKKEIRNFGIMIGIILIIISSLLFYYNKDVYQIFAIISVIIISLGLFIPIILKPVYFSWMTFAVILGWVMTRVILTLIFYLIITPIGLLARLFGEDFLALKTSNINSYWNDRDSSVELNQDYEKQF